MLQTKNGKDKVIGELLWTDWTVYAKTLWQREATFQSAALWKQGQKLFLMPFVSAAVSLHLEQSKHTTNFS